MCRAVGKINRLSTSGCDVTAGVSTRSTVHHWGAGGQNNGIDTTPKYNLSLYMCVYAYTQAYTSDIECTAEKMT